MQLLPFNDYVLLKGLQKEYPELLEVTSYSVSFREQAPGTLAPMPATGTQPTGTTTNTTATFSGMPQPGAATRAQTPGQNSGKPQDPQYQQMVADYNQLVKVYQQLKDPRVKKVMYQWMTTAFKRNQKSTVTATPQPMQQPNNATATGAGQVAPPQMTMTGTF